jgi:hypothetical protein
VYVVPDLTLNLADHCPSSGRAFSARFWAMKQRIFVVLGVESRRKFTSVGKIGQAAKQRCNKRRSGFEQQCANLGPPCISLLILFLETRQTQALSKLSFPKMCNVLGNMQNPAYALTNGYHFVLKETGRDIPPKDSAVQSA